MFDTSDDFGECWSFDEAIDAERDFLENEGWGYEAGSALPDSPEEDIPRATLPELETESPPPPHLESPAETPRSVLLAGSLDDFAGRSLTPNFWSASPVQRALFADEPGAAGCLRQSPPRRTRLTRKQPASREVYRAPVARHISPPEHAQPVASYEREPTACFATQLRGLRVREKFKAKAEFEVMSSRRRYDYLYDKVRSFWVNHLCSRAACQDSAALSAESSPKARGLALKLRRLWSQLGPSIRRESATTWLVCSQAPEWIRDAVDEVFAEQEQGKKIRAKCLLLTFIGPWKMQACHEPTAAAGRPSLNEVVLRLREEPATLKLWQRVQAHALALKQKLGACDYAVCLELCPESYDLQGIVQPHVHLCLRAAGFMTLASTSKYELDGAVPRVAHTVAGLCANRMGTTWAGFLYCCVEKVGHLWHPASRRPFKDFLVNPNWIMNLLQSRKVTVALARKLVLQCCNGSVRLLRELDVLEAEEEKEAIRRCQAEATLALQGDLCTWKTFPEVAAWARQYDLMQHRYKFLVLQGPSRLGKTVFARSLAPIGTEVLELNCAAGVEPDLRAYRLTVHGLVLFDEIEAEVVLKQRKLFQACAAPVQLGCSATNCHSYSVFVHRKRLVLASNNWHASVKGLPSSDQAWLQANSIVLDVAEPMWMSDDSKDLGRSNMGA